MELPHYRVGLPTLLGPSDGSPDPSRTSGWDSRPLPDLRVGLPNLPGGLGGLPGLPGGPPNSSLTFGWASQPFPDLRVGLQTLYGPPGESSDHSRTFG